MDLHDLYQPAPGPIDAQGMPRYTEDELRKIADLKEDRLNQAELHWDDLFSVTIASVTPPAIGPWTVVPSAGQAVDYVYPDQMYDQTTGTIYAPYDGEYVITMGMRLEDPGGVVTADYWLGVGSVLNVVAPPGNRFLHQQEQTKMNTVHTQWTHPCVAGDIIIPQIASFADSHTASADILFYLEIKRLR